MQGTKIDFIFLEDCNEATISRKVGQRWEEIDLLELLEELEKYENGSI